MLLFAGDLPCLSDYTLLNKASIWIYNSGVTLPILQNEPHLDPAAFMELSRPGMDPAVQIMHLCQGDRPWDSAFTVGVVEDCNMAATPQPSTVMVTSPKMVTIPESLPKMAASPETFCKMAARSETVQKMAATPDTFHKMTALPEFCPVMATVPESHPIMAAVPEPAHVKPAHVRAAIPELPALMSSHSLHIMNVAFEAFDPKCSIQSGIQHGGPSAGAVQATGIPGVSANSLLSNNADSPFTSTADSKLSSTTDSMLSSTPVPHPLDAMHCSSPCMPSVCEIDAVHSVLPVMVMAILCVSATHTATVPEFGPEKASVPKLTANALI
ncbi:hypothetical protein M9458_055526 [Cirrhinus mrigala]|uniref:Uncharacterized protein n=1 Tax=Cirrhinus mrigala TaxID=683832 RepID=A0ABD0MJK2_CIRMR